MIKRFLFVLFFCNNLLLAAQDEALSIDRWEKLKSGLEYTQSASKTKKTDKKPEETGKRRAEEDPEPVDSEGSVLNLGPAIQVVIIVLFITFIILLLYFLVGDASLKSNPKIKREDGDFIEPIEDNFTRGNLEKWLQYAIREKDFYLILRIHFLLTLKSLENHKLIVWKKEKTNWQYIQELGNHDFKTPFSLLVNDFDRVWYGEKIYSRTELESKIDQFKEFHRLIESK